MLAAAESSLTMTVKYCIRKNSFKVEMLIIILPPTLFQIFVKLQLIWSYCQNYHISKYMSSTPIIHWFRGVDRDVEITILKHVCSHSCTFQYRYCYKASSNIRGCLAENITILTINTYTCCKHFQTLNKKRVGMLEC